MDSAPRRRVTAPCAARAGARRWRRRRVSGCASSLAVVFGIAVAGACGPSPRRVHYGDVHFERCAAADAVALRPATEREACWEAWLAHYTLGQSGARVAYAEARASLLRHGVDGPLLAGLVVPAPATTAGVHPAAGGALPAPDVAPPAVAPPGAGPAAAAEARTVDPPPPPPGERLGLCAPVCRPRYDTCAARCTQGHRDCETACDVEHALCLRACP